MIRVAPVRKSLAFPTIFNVLGPLINPARPEAMVVGVHSRSLGPIFAEALRLTGVQRAWVVCGAEGLDEISPAGTTYVRVSLLLRFYTDEEYRCGVSRRTW
jgi:anthranilate phosphoribosyltransferase